MAEIQLKKQIILVLFKLEAVPNVVENDL